MKSPAIDFSLPSYEVAPQLIGCEFYVDGVGGVIVEVEAYDQSEAAAHTFKGKNLRNAAMFGAPGCAYVYRSYGIHWCLNFVCAPEGHGAGVLLRALEPRQGADKMRARRGVTDVRLLCAGPGRLGQALAVHHEMNGLVLDAQPFALYPPAHSLALVCGPRVGISKAVDLPWRFGLAGSAFLSRAFGQRL